MEIRVLRHQKLRFVPVREISLNFIIILILGCIIVFFEKLPEKLLFSIKIIFPANLNFQVISHLRDQLGPIPTNPFPIGNICPNHFRRKGFSRGFVRLRVNKRMFRTWKPNGKMWSTKRKVHVLLHAFQRRCHA